MTESYHKRCVRRRHENIRRFEYEHPTYGHEMIAMVFGLTKVSVGKILRAGRYVPPATAEERVKQTEMERAKDCWWRPLKDPIDITNQSNIQCDIRDCKYPKGLCCGCVNNKNRTVNDRG